MAKVEILEYREQLAHFGFYRQGAGGDVQLLIRRKVGDPTDYMHNHSKAVQRQREIFSQASIHYSHLTPTQKAAWRRQIRWVSRIPPGSKSEEVILKGRQLFISEDIHELTTKQRQIRLPREICIVLTDQELNPLVGQIWLFLFADGEWWELPREQLSKSDWLFPTVPRGAEFYRVHGEAFGYIDPELPETQYMSEDALRVYHYHRLSLWQPPAGVIFPSLADDGYLATWLDHPSASYAFNWQAQEGTLEDYGTAFSLYNHDYLDSASVYRGVLFFDTRELPPDANILNAWVKLTAFGIINCRNARLCLTPATNVHTPLIPSDYSALRETPDIIASYPMENMIAWSPLYLPLIQEGLSAITKAGITRFGLRIDFEIEAKPCHTCYEGIRILTHEQVMEVRRPTLIIDYTIP